MGNGQSKSNAQTTVTTTTTSVSSLSSETDHRRTVTAKASRKRSRSEDVFTPQPSKKKKSTYVSGDLQQSSGSRGSPGSPLVERRIFDALDAHDTSMPGRSAVESPTQHRDAELQHGPPKDEDGAVFRAPWVTYGRKTPEQSKELRGRHTSSLFPVPQSDEERRQTLRDTSSKLRDLESSDLPLVLRQRRVMKVTIAMPSIQRIIAASSPDAVADFEPLEVPGWRAAKMGIRSAKRLRPRSELDSEPATKRIRRESFQSTKRPERAPSKMRKLKGLWRSDGCWETLLRK